MGISLDRTELAGLLSGLRAEDARAQTRYWQLFFGPVHRVCVRLVGEGLMANELASEVLADFLLRYLASLDRPEALGEYLRLMAVRRCRRELKRQHRFAATEMDRFEYQPDKTESDPAADGFLIQRLEECLGRLSPKAQHVLKLRYFGDYTNESIGGLLGGSKQYIGKLIRRSQELLAECLEKKRVSCGEIPPGAKG